MAGVWTLFPALAQSEANTTIFKKGFYIVITRPFPPNMGFFFRARFVPEIKIIIIYDPGLRAQSEKAGKSRSQVT